MSKKVGSDGQIRKTTAEWAADTLAYPEGMRLMDTDTGTVRVSKGTTYALAWTPATGGGGETPVGIPYTFEATYNASGIANGEVRVDNATAGSITAIYIAQNDATVTDFGPVLATLSAGGLLYLNTTADDTAVAVFKITAAVDSGTYYTLTGSFLSGVMPGDGSEIRVTVAPVEVTGVKRYVALLSQTGTDAPVATVLENTLGGTVVWTYSDTGSYLATLAGAFPDDKTVILLTPNDGSYSIVAATAVGGVGNYITYTQFDTAGAPIDGGINKMAISVTVYP